MVLPTYNEAENIEPFVAAVRSKLPADAAGADRRRQLARRDRRERRPARRDGTPTSASCTAAPRKASAPPTSPASGGRSPAGPGWCWRWTPTSPTIPPTCRGCSSAAQRADLVIGSRYVAGGGVSDWGPVRRADQPRRQRLRAARAGVDVHDLTGGFKCFRREVLEAIDLDSIQARGYAFQVEMTYRAIQPASGRRGADRLPRPPGRRVEDGRRDRRRGDLAGAAAAIRVHKVEPRTRLEERRRSLTSARYRLL